MALALAAVALATAGPSASASPVPTTAQKRYVRGLGRDAVLRLDQRTGAVRFLARRDGFLSGPRRGDAAKLALRWVRAHLDVLGLREGDLDTLSLASRRVSADGTTRLIWRQRAGGLPAFDETLRINVRRDGRILSVGGSPRSGLTRPSGRTTLDAQAAVRAAGGGRTLAEPALTLVTLGNGRSVVAWKLVLEDAGSIWSVLVDARSARVLRRVNLVLSAKGLAYPKFPGSPSGGAQVEVDFDRWLTEPGRLISNNTHVYNDADDSEGAGPVSGNLPLMHNPTPAEEIAPGDDGNWLYAFSPVPSPAGNCPEAGCAWNHAVNGSWAVNVAQDGTQLFWAVNRFHDHLAAPPISFGEPQGALQGDDPVYASNMDGAAIVAGRPIPGQTSDNANMYTPPNGQPAWMQMYLYEPAPDAALGPTGWADVSSSSDTAIVYHEYTHGLTQRLVTREDGWGALSSPQAGALGESLSDFFALDLLLSDGHDVDTSLPGEVRLGAYVDGGRNIVRSQPLDCTVGAAGEACPRTGTQIGGAGGYTYADFGKITGAPEVHADGEIWGETMMDLRRRFVADHGTAEGTRRVRHLIARALEMVVAEPSFLDLRDAILLADTNAGAKDRRRIWEVFGARGMGVSAFTQDGSDTAPKAAFDLPPLLAPTDTIGPALTIDEPDEGAVVRGEAVVLVGTAIDDSGIVTFLVNGAPAPLGGETWTARMELPAGRHTITVRAIDIEGRDAVATRTLISDRAAPVIRKPRLRKGVLTAVVTDDVGVASVKVGKRGVRIGRRGRLRVKKVKGRSVKLTVTDRAGRVVTKKLRARRG
jgi:hypothetical protein